MAPFDLSRPGVYRFSFGNPFDPCSFTFRLRELADGEKIYNGIAAISPFLTFDEMLETRPYVVRGTISRYGDSVLRGTHACTQKYIRVSEVFRGNIAVGDEICFFDFGGETDTHSTTTSPPSNFELGTESYFFISEDGLALPYLWTGDQFGDFLRERLAALNL
jgi:hypothetical protein